jgi:8-oxo-dGTP pyrophosphatase MutT (NUDIX family)
MQEKKQAVYGIVFNPARTEVLLVKRRDVPVWVLPGGGLDPGETAEAGALRELEEETGFHCLAVRKVAEYLPVNWMTQLSHLFECRIASGAPTPSAETAEARFFPVGELPDMPPPYPQWIREAQPLHNTLIRKPIEGVTHGVLLGFLLTHPLLVCRYLYSRLRHLFRR